MLNDRIPLVDDIEPPKDQDETDEKLLKQVNIAVYASVILTVVLLVVWPLPMHFGAGVFSKGGFTVWVALEMIWAIIGGIVIIGLPVFETIKGFNAAKKEKAERDAKEKSGSSELSDGSVLKIAAQPAVPSNKVEEAPMN